MAEKGMKRQSLLNGALVLVIATALVKVIGALFKIPITSLIGTVGRGYFGSAYNIFIPVYNIAMAGLPVAISKLVAQNIALGRYRDVRLLFKIAKRIFLLTGLAGMVILFILAYPYAVSIKTMPVIPSILVIAPSIYFCCLMASYRGYYSGLRNMNPTAVSQVIEALGKLILGILLAKLTMDYGIKSFESGKKVFGKTVTTNAEALSATYPYAAAAAVAGVTIGTVFALLYLMLRHKIRSDGISKAMLRSSPKPLPVKKLTYQLIGIAVPVVASTIIMNLTNFIDSWSIQFRLSHAIASDEGIITAMYKTALAAADLVGGDLKTYLYGAYETALDFKNLLPAFTMTLGVSAIPVLSEAWTLRNKRVIKTSVESVIRVIMLISMPAGIGMAVLAEPILRILYGSMSSVSISAPVMAYYGYVTFLIALSQPITNMLQAIGRMDIPMKILGVAAVFKILVNFIFVGMPRFNIFGAVIGTVVFYIIIVGASMFFLIRETKVKLNYFNILIKPFFCSVLCGLAAWSSHGLLSLIIDFGDASSRLNGNTVCTVLAIGIAVVVYGLSLLFTRAIAKTDLNMIPGGEKISKTLEKYGFIG